MGKQSCSVVWTLLMATVIAVLGRPANAAESRATVVVHASNQAAVSADVLARAQQEVVRIFHDCDVDVVWEDDLDRVAAESTQVRSLFVILASAKAFAATAVDQAAMGAAVTTSRTRGRVAYIFYSRVEYVAAVEKTDVANMLGHAMAHEIGHLMLPPGHSATGLMRANWIADDFKQARRGRLLFTNEQAVLIRASLRGNRTGLLASAREK